MIVFQKKIIRISRRDEVMLLKSDVTIQTSLWREI